MYILGLYRTILLIFFQVIIIKEASFEADVILMQ